MPAGVRYRAVAARRRAAARAAAARPAVPARDRRRSAVHPRLLGRRPRSGRRWGCSGRRWPRTPRCSRPPRAPSTPSRSRSSRSPPTAGSACSGSASGCSPRSRCGRCCAADAGRSGLVGGDRRRARRGAWWPGRWAAGSGWRLPAAAGLRPGRHAVRPNRPTCGPGASTGPRRAAAAVRQPVAAGVRGRRHVHPAGRLVPLALAAPGAGTSDWPTDLGRRSDRTGPTYGDQDRPDAYGDQDRPGRRGQLGAGGGRPAPTTAPEPPAPGAAGPTRD